MAGLGAALALLAGCTVETGPSDDDGTSRPETEADVTQWLHDRSAQYEERDGVLSTASAPAGASGAHEFDGPVTVDSVEAHCFGEDGLTVQVDFTTTSGRGSVEVEMECAEGVQEVAMEGTDIDHSAVTALDVRSFPPSDGRHYVVALGAPN